MRDALLRLRYRYWPDHLLGEILSKRWTETAIPVIVLLIVGFALSRSIPSFLSLGEPRRHRAPGRRDRLHRARHGAGRHRRRHRPLGRLDVRADAISARSICLNVLGWPVPAVIVATLACGALLGAVNGLLIGYLRLRAFITTLITLIIYRSAYDLSDPALLQQDRGGVPRHPVLGFHRRRRRLRHSERGAGLYRRRHLRPCLPDPAAAGLAHHRDRRLAPLGLQFRHSGAAHDRALLRRKRRADQRSARCSSPPGSAPSAATSASAWR